MNRVLAVALLLIAVPCLADTAAAGEDPPLSAAGLMAQAADPAVTGSAPEPATASASPASGGGFPPDHLEQLVAPIALYPDALLTQVLMASTYPLEIVEANRFMSKNPELKDDALDKALMDQDWDPSVKSLCKLPDVLKKMSENLDWTQDLGDAVLEQQTEVMDTIQRMRGKAYEAGNLKTSEQQVVTQQQDKIIVIESPDPEIVYVPTYSSTVVYGSSWGYPSYYYPPMYPAYPPGYGLISFGVGMAVGAAIWGDCNWGWGGSDINIDIDRYNEFNRNTNINADRTRVEARQGGGNKGSWQHDASHRKGVNYRDQNTAQKYGGASGANRVTKDQARGRSTANTSNRAGPGGASGDRSAGTAGSRPSASTRPSSADRSASSRPSSATQSRAGSSSAFSGSRSSSADRMSSSRGASSRGASSFGGSRGGGRRR
jgi:hypothetical protein